MRALTTFLFVLAFFHLFAQPTLNFVEIANGFSRPVDIANANDGTNRLFVVEKGGTIDIIELDNANNVLPDPFLDISGIIDDSANEQGLLGLAFHPEFPDSNYFYVNYTRDPGPTLDRTVVARYEVSSTNPDSADENSALTIIEIEQDFSNHNGGDLNFGPDGYLYIGMGDGGSGGDPNCRAQDTSSLLGKMLRIDVDSIDVSPPGDLCGLVNNYLVPSDNPYLGGSGTCDEIWDMGLRNPWRFSFDMTTGDMYIADVGQLDFEEINVNTSDTAATNYGWKVMEATSCFDEDPIDVDCPTSTASCFDASYTDPVFEYDHNLGCSVTGGYVYRGSTYPNMVGYYIFMDYCTSRIWSLISDGEGGWDTNVQVLGGFGNITTFGEDEAGEMYAAEDGGGASVYQLIDESVVPVHILSFTGREIDNNILLEWEIASSYNFSHFEIEKRNSNGTFEKIGKVDPDVNVSYRTQFNFLDQNVKSGKNYYRLKILDLDGEFEYSKLIIMDINRWSFDIFPNPGQNFLSIKLTNYFLGNVDISIYDTVGNKLLKEKVAENNSIYTLKNLKLESGIYMVCVESQENVSCEKLIINK